MPCDALGPDLSALADGEIEPAARARLDAHLSSCASCRRSLATWRAAGEALRREDETPEPAQAFLAALGRRRARPLRYRRWLVPVAAALLVAALLSFDRVRAAREAGLLVEMEGRNRTEASRLLGRLESMRYEIAALGLRAKAEGSSDSARIAADLRTLVEALERLDDRVREIQTDLDREGLFSALKESTDEPRNR